MSEVVAEFYENRLYHYQPTIRVSRWWVPGYPLMVGGSLLDSADWEHLARDFEIEYCLNVETEHDDAGKVPAGHLCQARVSDEHCPPIPYEALATALDFAQSKPLSAKIYVHCQMGGSRSPAFAYLILRGKYGLDPAPALAKLNEGFIVRQRASQGEAAQPYGHHSGHWTYMNSIEGFLAARGIK